MNILLTVSLFIFSVCMIDAASYQIELRYKLAYAFVSAVSIAATVMSFVSHFK